MHYINEINKNEYFINVEKTLQMSSIDSYAAHNLEAISLLKRVYMKRLWQKTCLGFQIACLKIDSRNNFGQR